MRRRKNLILPVAIFTAVILAATASAFAASTEKVLYSFCATSGCTDGASPSFGTLVFDGKGNLYGTTSGGGVGKCKGGCGTVFQLVLGTNGWTHNVLHSFNGKDGTYPSGLIFDAAGNLYGTTELGGAHNAGTAYRLSPGGNGKWSEKLLYSFGGKAGTEPNPSLVFDTAGNLYGTTLAGGGEKGGVVFELTPSAKGAWSETILHSNHTGARGPGPYGYGGLTLGGAQNLYGVTMGALGSAGEVFGLSPGSHDKWKQEILYRFDSGDGAGPFGGMIFDTAGNLYGATWEGGSEDCEGGCGVIFELTPAANGTWTETVLNNFNGNDGYQANGPLIFDSEGNLYGTTGYGGTYDGGTVFELTPGMNGAWSEIVLHSFCALDSCADGQTPFTGVILDAAGNLYGTTQSGGASGYGTVFEITP
jgi:uncharacterized repeat protein (TIGR03803 family)